jgi:hypothetical protein
LDALIVSNQLSLYGSQAFPLEPTDPQVDVWYLDVSGDKALSPLDALMVINYLNPQNASAADGEVALSSMLYADCRLRQTTEFGVCHGKYRLP